MISRRRWLGGAVFGFLTSACTDFWGGAPRPSLTQVLQSLLSIGTGAEFAQKYGEPFSKAVTGPLDVHASEVMKDLDVIIPPDLIKKWPQGAQVLLYYFTSYKDSALNPIRGTLHVVVGENDRIVVWTYGQNLLGYLNSAHLDTELNGGSISR